MVHTWTMNQRAARPVVEVATASASLIDQLVALGDTAAETLGMLPPSAYRDAAGEGRLLVARSGDEIAGYVLFRRPRSEVALTHVCVAHAYRRGGVARLLVDEVSTRNKTRHGLRAKCRDDYEIAAFWRALGFDLLGTTHGRGADRAPMTVWWRDHQIPNLFSPPVDEQPTALPVAIDTNILMDLHTRTGTRSHVLLGPDLTDRMELVVPPGLEKDLAAQPAERRARLVEAADRYPRPSGDPVRAQSVFDTLLATIRTRLSTYPTQASDLGDLWQIVHAAAAGIQVFATWDDRLRAIIGPIVAAIDRSEFNGFRIVDPDHLFTHVDQLAHAAAYQPRALQGSQFSTQRAGADSEPILLAFLNQAAGETKPHLRAQLRDLARSGQPLIIVRDTDSAPMACYATQTSDTHLRVPLLRVADHAYAETMARRLLWLLREQARNTRARMVIIDDPYLSPVLERAARYESYERSGDRWMAWVIDACGTSLEVSTAVSAARQTVDLAPVTLLKPHLPAEVAAQYERDWWPAKLTDSDLPHFAVAIKPEWSAYLFGRPETLTERPTQLALGREQVYYRSGKNSALRAPSRILWFLSQDKTAQRFRARHRGAPPASSFIGTSLLDAIQTDTPDALHAALGHYGVYTLDRIRAAADRRGLVQALRISDTELFPSPVTWRQYETLLTTLAGPKMILAPVPMPTDTFAAIYALGTRRAEPSE
jgi:GNAT superfamily N-acetyltransferase